MAGPQMIGVRNVINPYEDASKSLAAAYAIYDQGQRSAREQERFNWDKAEQDRTTGQRDFLSNYNANLGVDGRGLSRDAMDALGREEVRVNTYFKEQEAAGKDTTQEREQYRRDFDRLGRSLVSTEAAQDQVMRDLVASGRFTPAEAQAASGTFVLGTRGETDRLNLANADIKARRTALENRFEAVMDVARLDADILKNQNTAKATIFRGSRGGSGSGNIDNTGGNVAGRLGSPAQQAKELVELEKSLSSLVGSSDSKKTINYTNQAIQDINRDRVSSGLRPLSTNEAYTAVLRAPNLKRIFDSSFANNDPAIVAALVREYGEQQDIRESLGGFGGRPDIQGRDYTAALNSYIAESNAIPADRTLPQMYDDVIRGVMGRYHTRPQTRPQQPTQVVRQNIVNTPTRNTAPPQSQPSPPPTVQETPQEAVQQPSPERLRMLQADPQYNREVANIRRTFDSDAWGNNFYTNRQRGESAPDFTARRIQQQEEAIERLQRSFMPSESQPNQQLSTERQALANLGLSPALVNQALRNTAPRQQQQTRETLQNAWQAADSRNDQRAKMAIEAEYRQFMLQQMRDGAIPFDERLMSLFN